MAEYSDLMWIEQIPHELKNTRRKKAKRVSLYRQSKICAHRTANGRGCVARLMERKRG